MFCLVAGDGAENKEICIACEDKQWCFTLYMTNEFGTKFYSLLETKELFTINAELYDDPFNADISFENAGINLSGVPQNEESFEAGDLVICPYAPSFYMIIFGEGKNGWQSGLKVGELEKSSIDDFKSFIEGKVKINSGYSASFTFSIKEPEPQFDTKIIVTSIILLLLLLPLLLLVYFIFK